MDSFSPDVMHCDNLIMKEKYCLQNATLDVSSLMIALKITHNEVMTAVKSRLLGLYLEVNCTLCLD